MSRKNLTFIDLFAGAGGLSEGFIRAGYEPIAHVEMDEAACYTLKTRAAYHWLTDQNKEDVYVQYLKGGITRQDLYEKKVPSRILESVINYPIGGDFNPKIHKIIDGLLNGRDVDLIIGGPPCQAYSLVGRARKKDGMKGDHRNYLYVQYARYLEKYKPKMFVFENVLGLKSAGKGIYLENMEKLFNKKGYQIKLFTVAANNFGVLQNRKRVVIIGWQENLHIELPDLEKVTTDATHTVGELFDDLPELQAGGGKDKFTSYRIKKVSKYLQNTGIRNGIDVLTQHIARPHTAQDKEIYRLAIDRLAGGKRLNYNELPEELKTHKNRHSFFDRFKVVKADAPYSHTVVAHIAKDGHYYIHPDKKQNRSITVREAARLQSFPDDFYFEGVKEGKNRTAAFKQIGNAVPPILAGCIAEKIKPLLQ